MLHSLDHAIIAVRDLDVAEAHYTTLLGRRRSWRGLHPGAGSANVLFRLDNTYLELLAPHGDGPVGRRLSEALDRSGEGMFGLAFGTPDLDEAVAEFGDAGVAVGDPNPGRGTDSESGAERLWRNAFLTTEASRGLLLFAIEHETDPEVLPPAPHEGPEGAAVASVDHAVVASGDLEASAALYGRGLGLRLALDRTFEARGIRILFYRVGGVTVEVVGRLGNVDSATTDRFQGLAYRVPDARAAHARLAGAGFDLTNVRDGFKPGTRVFTVRDATASVPTLMIEPTAP